MTPDQINQLRTKLKLALTFYDDALFNASAGAVSEALALLPCETCNGTEIKPPKDGCGECLAGDGNCWADCPRPDCE